MQDPAIFLFSLFLTHHTNMEQTIVGFHQDEHGDWVADLACGHGQHVRHNPPWSERRWVMTEQGRKHRLGEILFCKKCVEEKIGG